MKVYGYEVYQNDIGGISISQNTNNYDDDGFGNGCVWLIFTPEQIDRLCEDLQKVKNEMLEGKNG